MNRLWQKLGEILFIEWLFVNTKTTMVYYVPITENGIETIYFILLNMFIQNPAKKDVLFIQMNYHKKDVLLKTYKTKQTEVVIKT